MSTNVTEPRTTKSTRAPLSKTGVARLIFLEASQGRIFSVNPDGSDKKVLVSECRIPDGVAIDVEAGHIYWTNMGVPNRNDGSIERADLDGRNRKTIIPQGDTFTPKQLQLDKENGKLYWCDREGMRVMCANLDGSNIETLVDTSHGDPRPGPDVTRWCVGIAVDSERGHFYWTQKGPEKGGLGRLLRANIKIPKGENAVNRTDIEVLYEGLPEPIDLELDLKNRLLYWTDRGDPPRGNTVNRAPMVADSRKGAAPPEIVLTHSIEGPVPDILVTHLMEGIGIALDLKGNRMFVTDLAGSLYSAKLDGSEKKTVLAAQGNLTGIAYL